MNSVANPTSRRQFLRSSTVLAGTTLLTGKLSTLAAERASSPLHVACNQYTWQVYFGRENRSFGQSLTDDLAEVAQAGLDGFEPMASSPDQIRQMGRTAKGQGLAMRSLYVNSVLHETDQADRSIAQVVAIAEAAKPFGTRIIVTNPSPIRWGGEENKTDAQLRCQADAMNRLGTKLEALGLELAYHNHDIELRHAAREFHHMMVGTDATKVFLCLDAHWIYRGSGNSSVALFDVVKLYGRRAVELHIRQSQAGVWSETLDDGDIDYRRLVDTLVAMGVRPHLVLEQAVEEGTPRTVGALEANRKSAAYLRRVFGPLAG